MSSVDERVTAFATTPRRQIFLGAVASVLCGLEDAVYLIRGHYRARHGLCPGCGQPARHAESIHENAVEEDGPVADDGPTPPRLNWDQALNGPKMDRLEPTFDGTLRDPLEFGGRP